MNNNTNPFEEHGLASENANLSADLTIDPEKAWLKMSRSALAEPNDWLVCLIEAAILKGAESIYIKASLPRNIYEGIHYY